MATAPYIIDYRDPEADRGYLESEARGVLSGIAKPDGCGLKIVTDDWRDAFAALHYWAENQTPADFAELSCIQFTVMGESFYCEPCDFTRPEFDPFIDQGFADDYEGQAVLSLEGDRDDDWDGCAIHSLLQAMRDFGVQGSCESVRVYGGSRYDRRGSCSVRARFDLAKAYSQYVADYEEEHS